LRQQKAVQVTTNQPNRDLQYEGASSASVNQDSSGAALTFDDVTMIFHSKGSERLKALDRVSFNVAPNEFVSIIGPSGCGKSTLLRLAAGLAKPAFGMVRMGDHAVTAPEKSVGMVFQQPLLLPWRSVIDNVLLPAEILRLKERGMRAEALRLLELAGLEKFKDGRTYNLSGGMQQRVAICRALIHDPSILLMDEPFGALDAITREDMSYTLLKIWQQRRKTVLFVTHSISEAVMLSDRIIIMTQRPGTVREIIKVNLARPRAWEMEQTTDFQKLVLHLKGMLQNHGK
jgi:NitT/TauT family transport system ATP-binding protein